VSPITAVGAFQSHSVPRQDLLPRQWDKCISCFTESLDSSQIISCTLQLLYYHSKAMPNPLNLRKIARKLSVNCKATEEATDGNQIVGVPLQARRLGPGGGWSYGMDSISCKKPSRRRNRTLPSDIRA